MIEDSVILHIEPLTDADRDAFSVRVDFEIDPPEDDEPWGYDGATPGRGCGIYPYRYADPETGEEIVLTESEEARVPALIERAWSWAAYIEA